MISALTGFKNQNTCSGSKNTTGNVPTSHQKCMFDSLQRSQVKNVSLKTPTNVQSLQLQPAVNQPVHHHLLDLPIWESGDKCIAWMWYKMFWRNVNRNINCQRLVLLTGCGSGTDPMLLPELFNISAIYWNRCCRFVIRHSLSFRGVDVDIYWGGVEGGDSRIWIHQLCLVLGWKWKEVKAGWGCWAGEDMAHWK